MHNGSPKKLSQDKNFTFSFAHAEMRKRVFLNFLRYLPTDFEVVTEYVFGKIARMIYSVNFFIRTGGNTLVQMRKRVFSIPISLFHNGFTCNSEYRCTMEALKCLSRENSDFIICVCRNAQTSSS